MNQMQNAEQLGQDKISKLILRFSIPAVIGMVVQSIYNIVDRIFIGQSVGALGIAGITVSFPIMLILMAVGMLVAVGATSLISIKLGQGKPEEAENIMGNAALLLVASAVTISFFGLVFINPLLGFFGASSSVLPYARDYMGIILFGSVFQAISFGMNNFIRAEGNPRIAMATMLIGALLNIILDPIFIFGLGMGVKGAALATVLAQSVSAAWVLSYFLTGKSDLKFRRKNFRPKASIIGGIAAIGSAPFAVQMANSGLMVILNNSLLHYGGDLAISTMGIAQSISTMILMPIFGISQGVQPIIGYNYGAQKFDRVIETLKLAALSATTVALLGFLTIRFFPHQLIMLFSKEDTALIAMGVVALRTYLLFLPLVGLQIVCSQYFQATGKPKQAMFLSLSRQVLLLIPAIIILPRYFGLNGIWMAGPVADFGATTLTLVWISREVKLQLAKLLPEGA
jgi:putative MATE family efflux protein